jgi:hypothetical protein
MSEYIKWKDGKIVPMTQEEIERMIADSQRIPPYTLLRANDYPPIQEQLDMIYWDKINGTDNWEKSITAVKEKYPKT